MPYNIAGCKALWIRLAAGSARLGAEAGRQTGLCD